MSLSQPSQNCAATERITFLDSIVKAQVEEMERDERVIMMGEDLAVYGDGKVVQRFGANRIWSTPISETSFTGMGVGAAISGLRPIIALNIASFMYLASDPIINHAAKLPFMTGGRVRVPIVFRCGLYYQRSLAAQHSDRPYPMFMNVPGLKLIYPSTPQDMKGLLKSSIRDDDPVVVFEDTRLWTTQGEVSVDPDLLEPLGKAVCRRVGSDVTVVALGGAMRPALDAAESLAEEGVSVEVLDPRTIKPLDLDTIISSVAKTGRLVLVENAHRVCSVTSEIAALVACEAFDALRKPIQQLAAPDVHIPFSPTLEQSIYPDKARIIQAIRRVL